MLQISVRHGKIIWYGQRKDGIYMSETPVLIGLCGRSGAGKGIVASVFADFGMAVIDTDAVYREMTSRSDTPCMQALIREFGCAVVSPDGSLDRTALADIVFTRDTSRLSVLNRITHKYIIDECDRRIAHLSESGKRLAVIDAPLLFESGLNERCTVTVALTAPDSVLIERICRRDGITRSAALRRIAQQMSNDDLGRRTDYIIENSGDIEELKLRAAAVAKDILGRFLKTR